jgi:thiol:disulfide interchange protein
MDPEFFAPRRYLSCLVTMTFLLPRILRPAWFLFLALFCTAGLLRAQVEASLVALKTTIPADAREITVGLRLVHQPHWHTYWLQPGTGLPTTLEWQLPEGWTAGPIRWPAPMRVYDTAKNLAGHGYEGTVTLPVTLTLPPGGLAAVGNVILRARADWLMCKDVCKPGSAPLSLTLTPLALGSGASEPLTDTPEGADLLVTVESLPRPLPPLWQATATRLNPTAKTITLTVQPPTGQSLGESPWYFDADAAIAYEELQRPIAQPPAAGFAVALVISPYAEAAPTRLRGVLTFADGPAYTLDLPITPPVPSSAKTPALGAVLLAAFFGGLILNLMPCVFPVLGLKVMGFVQQAGADRKKITTHGLVFTGGVLLSFWLLALVLALLRAGGTQLGWGFQLQSPAFVYVLAALLLAFALNMSGVFEFALRATALGGEWQRKQGLAGSFFTGVLATLVATPCSAPFLAPALGAALALPVAASFVVFTAIGLGLSAPYLLLAAYPAALRFMPRPGAWMESFKQGLAFLLYGTVGLMLWILAGQVSADALLAILLALTGLGFALWLYGRATAPETAVRPRPKTLGVALLIAAAALAYGWPQPASPDDLVWEPWSSERVSQLQAEGRPVYVDFTARWCFTCQTNKKALFHGPGSSEVRKIFRELNVATLRADWTNRDPLITAELARWDRAAVPFNLLYLPDSPTPRILPELLTPATVLERFSNEDK